MLRRRRVIALGGCLLACLIPGLGLAAGAEAGSAHHGSVSASEIFRDWQFWGAVTNFALLVLILYRLARRPVANFLVERQRVIEQGINEAAALKEEAQQVFDEYTRRLQTMDEELAKLRTDIREAAEADKQRILVDAEAAAARMRKETEALVVQQSREMADTVRAEVAQAAVSAAEEVLRRVLSHEDQTALAKQFRQDLASPGGRS